jgi:hypothetical protein
MDSIFKVHDCTASFARIDVILAASDSKFEELSGMDTAGYAAAVKAFTTDEDQYFGQVAAKVWASSKVARAKFLASAWALTALGMAVLLLGVAAIVRFSRGSNRSEGSA